MFPNIIIRKLFRARLSVTWSGVKCQRSPWLLALFLSLHQVFILRRRHKRLLEATPAGCLIGVARKNDRHMRIKASGNRRRALSASTDYFSVLAIGRRKAKG